MDKLVGLEDSPVPHPQSVEPAAALGPWLLHRLMVYPHAYCFGSGSQPPLLSRHAVKQTRTWSHFDLSRLLPHRSQARITP